jgi:hypothetical protein
MIDIQAAIAQITSNSFPKWTVLIGIGAYNPSQLLDETDFFDLVIEDKMNNIPTATITFTNRTEDTLQDQGIRIYLDGKKKFTGVIKKCSKSYQSNLITCECLGIAFEFQRTNITTQKDIIKKKSSEIITENFTPVNWTIDIDTTSNDFVISHRIESGNYLTHINNICVQNHWEWWVEETDSTSTFATRILKIASRRGKESPSKTYTLESSGYNAVIDKDKDKLKNTVLVSGSSSQTSNTNTTAAGFFSLGDSENPTAMGFMIGSESHLVRPVLSDESEPIQIINAVLAEPVTIGDETVTTNGTNGFAPVGTIIIGSEILEYSSAAGGVITLISPATAGHNTGVPVIQVLALEDVTGYQDTGTVLIDDEEITYAGRDLTTNTLFLTNSVAQPHEVGNPVLILSLIRAYVPTSVQNAQNKVWIGNELIQYEYVDYWGLHNVTRGCEYNDQETPAYAHGDGTKIFSGVNSLDNPAGSSSIGYWGQSDCRVNNIGSIDRDGLDKYGTSILLNLQRYEIFGSFQIIVDDLDLVVGDAFYLKETGTDNQTIVRCMGIKFEGDVVTFYLGQNEEYILTQFDSITKIDNSTYVKQDLDKSSNVVAVSPDETSVKVLKKDGTYEWVTVR